MGNSPVDKSVPFIRGINTPWSPPLLQGQTKKSFGGLSGDGQIPSLGSSMPIAMEQIELQPYLEFNSRAVHMIHPGKSEKPPDESITTLQDLAGSARRRRFETVFNIAIHTGRADPQVIMRRAKLDTASDVDAVSEEVVTSFGTAMERYAGHPISPLGPPINPIGEIQLEWHVSRRAKTYKTRFAVLNNDQSRGFDVLVGSKTIGDVGFYDKNQSVWFLGKANGVTPDC